MALMFAIGLVIVGACILAAALVPAGRLITTEPAGRRRYFWVAVALIFLIFVGYIGYAIIRWDSNTRLSDLGGPLVFFGGYFVLAVSALALTSAQGVRLLTALEREKITDSLMGIRNRRYFAGRLREEVARANRYRLPLAFMMVDVDHLEKINDTYGYAVGDRVLSALAKLTLSIVRDTDITARYGGEEIAVIAPITTAQTAATLAERLRQAVETAAWLPAEASVGDNAVGVTVSIGVSELGPHIRNAQTLVATADAALHAAKDGGCNRIAVS